MGDWFKRWPFLRDIFPTSPFQLVGPLLAAGAAGLLAAVIVIGSGLPNLAASKPHPEGWAKVLHLVFNRSTDHYGGDLKPPPNFGSIAEIRRGAGYYGMACAHCHSGPGLGQNAIAMAMRPEPQYLPAVLHEFNPGELFWIVQHGVKYSGMPAYAVQDRPDEAWAIVSFLRVLPKLTPQQFRALAYGDDHAGAPDNGIPSLDKGYALYHWRPGVIADKPRDEYFHGGPALGFDDVTQTGGVTAFCSRCHTNGGAAVAGGSVPNLTLLDRDYMQGQLTRFATGLRSSGMMMPIATQLSKQQIAALADYYTAHPRAATGGPAPDPQLVAQGAQIAQHGIGANGTGACVNCHGVQGAAKAYYPGIAGQNQGYLRTRLLTFRAPYYPQKPGNPMPWISRAMTPQQIDAVSAYYAAQAIGGGQPAAPPAKVASR